jgi:hypothetical protein
MNFEKKIDHRRKYYLIFDCETATLPCAANYDGTQKQKIAIAKPLIYDLGWQVIDRTGKVYIRKSFLISEIFSVPQVFNTAYYASKRPIYLEKLKNNEIILTDWKTATKELIKDLQIIEAVGAYNSMFDYKKAIPFTERYMKALYSQDFFSWEEKQNKICRDIATGKTKTNNNNFNGEIFCFRGKSYPLFDLWGLSCKYILNNDEYKQQCINNNWKSQSGKYYKTSAETTYRFLTNNEEFIESHTAVEDAIIESEIFAKILEITKNKFDIGIIYFPFRILGRIEQ